MFWKRCRLLAVRLHVKFNVDLEVIPDKHWARVAGLWRGDMTSHLGLIRTPQHFVKNIKYYLLLSLSSLILSSFFVNKLMSTKTPRLQYNNTIFRNGYKCPILDAPIKQFKFSTKQSVTLLSDASLLEDGRDAGPHVVFVVCFWQIVVGVRAVIVIVTVLRCRRTAVSRHRCQHTGTTAGCYSTGWRVVLRQLIIGRCQIQLHLRTNKLSVNHYHQRAGFKCKLNPCILYLITASEVMTLW